MASSKVPILVFNFYYLIKSLSFLPSALFENKDLLNRGLRDQNILH